MNDVQNEQDLAELRDTFITNIRKDAAEVDTLTETLNAKRGSLYKTIRDAAWLNIPVSVIAQAANRTPQRIHQILENSGRPKRPYRRSRIKKLSDK